MIDEIKYEEANCKDTQDRLDYLFQIVKNNPDDYPDITHVTVYTLGEGSSIKLSKTAARKWIRESWGRMERDINRPLPSYCESKTPSTELSLTNYHLLAYHRIKTVRTEENLAKLAKIEEIKSEVFKEEAK
jgi:hypothetical protein